MLRVSWTIRRRALPLLLAWNEAIFRKMNPMDDKDIKKDEEKPQETPHPDDHDRNDDHPQEDRKKEKIMGKYIN